MTIIPRDVISAADRLIGKAVVTPLLESPTLNERVRGRVLIKPEIFQLVGAFKFRGAYNRLSRLSEAERARGVVAFSSGNHAQGVALAALMLGMPSLIVMPSDAPQVKVDATRSYGAEIRFYDRQRESREEIAAQIAKDRGAIVVPAFDDPYIIAGQGTVGLEIAQQMRTLGADLELCVGPVGGGGLMSGVSVSLRSRHPDIEIYGVEPEAYDDTRRSLEAGQRVGAPPAPRSLCDSLEAPMPGEITFPILQENLTGVVTVSDNEVADAMRFAYSTLKLVVEPGGSVGLAALLNGKVPLNGRTAVLILSGGNVDPGLFAKVINGEI